jgi:hypothetical protein
MPDEEDETTDSEVSAADQKILDEALKRWELCRDAESDQRELALDDLEFRAGKGQWNEAIRKRRKAMGKPCITINVLPARERQILNDQRQNRPAIRVNAVDDYADPDTAEVLQGLIKHIEYDSHADEAYDTAFAAVVRTGGPGWIRLRTEYEDPMSNQLCVKIDRVRNQFSVYADPSSVKADGSDIMFAFQFEVWTKDEFRAEYPNAKYDHMESWHATGDTDPDWVTKEGVRVCDYFYKEMKPEKVIGVQNRAGEERSFLESEYLGLSAKDRKLLKVLWKRDTAIPTVHWCRHTATEILDKTIWPGQWIPLIPVYGDEVDVDGKLIREGMVRHTKDVVRMQNALSSAKVEAIALATKGPFISAVGQTENVKGWDTANVDNPAILRYNPVAGEPPPHHDIAEPPIQAISMAEASFIDQFKAITGIFDAQIGARSNENSGRAITARKQQGEISNFHYIDNLSRSLRFEGKQILDLILKLYTTVQVVRIIGEDNVQKTVKINQIFMVGNQQKKHDFSIGKYDVTMSSGGSFETRRKDAVDTLLQLVSSVPQLMPIAGDLIVGMMDFDQHQKLAERLRKSLPPGLADDEGDPKAQAQQMQAQMSQTMQQNQELTAQLQQAQHIIETDQIKHQNKMEEMAFDRETKIIVAGISAKEDLAQGIAEHELETDAAAHEQMRGHAHEVAMQAHQQSHEKDMGAQQADQAQQSQASDQAHQADMAAQAQEAEPAAAQ